MRIFFKKKLGAVQRAVYMPLKMTIGAKHSTHIVMILILYIIG